MRTKFFSALFLAIFLMPALQAQADSLQLPKMSQGQYIGGGVASIFLPFGIGQAIQGRYGEKGWIFTVSELGSLAVAGVGVAMSFSTIMRLMNNAKDSGVKFVLSSSDFPTGGYALMVAGGLAWSGFHIWGMIDAWATPQHEGRVADVLRDSQQKIAFMPLLAPNYVGFALQF